MTSRDTAPEAAPALRPGAELELDFTDLLTNGQGVGRAGSIVVFCFGPIPQERARVRITEVKQRYAVANTIEILRESPERAQPFCHVFGTCGGCQLQHLTYPAQLNWKRDAVRAALERIGGLRGMEVGETIGMAHPRAYRNKMSLVVEHRENPPALGFYRQRSHEIVPIDACPIVTPRLDEDLRRLNAARQSSAFADALRDARHIVARSSSATDESVLNVTTPRLSESVRRAAPLLMSDLARLAGVTNSYDPASANAIIGRRRSVAAGRDGIEEQIAGLRYRVSAGSFFQVNVEIVGKIFEHLQPWLSSPRAVVDLYCGVGTFALFFAKHGAAVHGIEESAEAVAEARQNALRNGLQELTRFTSGRVEQLASAPALRQSLGEATVVFLDPPRKGSDEVTLGAVAQARVREIWYLSCDPATLARDLKFLVAKGYRPISIQPFDMFPQTGHVETLVRMEFS